MSKVGMWMLGLALAPSCSSPGASTSQARLQTVAHTTFFHAGFGAGPAVFTEDTGHLLEERRFEPFGAAIDAPGLADRDLNELGKRTDVATGWSDHGARWMAPEIGRWLTPDPPVTGPDATYMAKPWGLHPYQYVNQNPISYWDPDGREPRDPPDTKPASLRQHVGSLDYYRFRNADFVKRHPGSTPPDYYLKYADKAIREFNSLEMSPMGKQWVEKTTSLLQLEIEDLRDRDPSSFDRLEQDGKAFRDFAFDSHPRAYMKGGLNDISPLDVFKVLGTVGTDGIFTRSGLKQTFTTFGMSLVTPTSQEKHWFEQCGTTSCK